MEMGRYRWRHPNNLKLIPMLWQALASKMIEAYVVIKSLNGRKASLANWRLLVC
jgi:hypothetical protein